MLYMKLSDTDQQALLQQLAAMPEHLGELFAGLSAERALEPGPNGSFSPVEQVWHLADLESEGFGARIDRLLHEAAPRLPDFDGDAIARERNYRSRSLAEGLAKFSAARRANLDRLQSVPAAAWSNAGVQDGVGTVSLCDMPVFLRQHDQAHLSEITAWLDQFHGHPH